jgi:hypothetical protein
MDAQHIAAAAIASEENDTACLSHLQNGEHVVTIQPEFLPTQ